MEQTRGFWAMTILALLVVLFGTDEVFAVAKGGRSRGSRSRSTSSRGGSRVSSTYISYRPVVRNTRVYLGYYNKLYTSYYNQYFYQSGRYYYINRQRPTGNISVCANYEANDNGTVMGVFSCPNSWEPRDYKYCCGQDYAEYCCKTAPNNPMLIIIVGAVLGGLAVIILIIMGSHRLRKSRVCRGCCKTKPHTTRKTVYQVPDRPTSHQQKFFGAHRPRQENSVSNNQYVFDVNSLSSNYSVPSDHSAPSRHPVPQHHTVPGQAERSSRTQQASDDRPTSHQQKFFGAHRPRQENSVSNNQYVMDVNSLSSNYSVPSDHSAPSRHPVPQHHIVPGQSERSFRTHKTTSV